MKHRKKQHLVRKPKSFLARGITKPDWWDIDPLTKHNTRQKLKREIDREIRSYE